MPRTRKSLTDIRSLARTHTETAVRTLVRIAASTKAPESAQVAAANSLLDRGWGKPQGNENLSITAVRAEDHRPDLGAILAGLQAEKAQKTTH